MSKLPFSHWCPRDAGGKFPPGAGGKFAPGAGGKFPPGAGGKFVPGPRGTCVPGAFAPSKRANGNDTVDPPDALHFQ